MMQFYFLSVLLNVVAGFLLISKKKAVADNSSDSEKSTELAVADSKASKSFFKSSIFTILVGVLSVLVGVIKLFVVAETKIVILGDFFPAIAGILGGFSVLVAYFVEKSSSGDNLNETFKKIFVTNSSLVGIACVVIGVLHFIFPSALFL